MAHKGFCLRLLLAFAGLNVEIVASAQNDAPQGEIPPQLLAPSDEARSFLAALEERPISGEALDRLPANLVASTEANLASLMAPGEIVPNRRETAIDLTEVAAAMPGGLQGNMVEVSHSFGMQRSYFTDRPVAPLLPPGARLVASDGPSIEPGAAEVEVTHISPKIIVVTRSVYRREGRLRCLNRAQWQFYSDPTRQASHVDTLSLVSSMLFMRRVMALGICFGAEEREPGTYVWRSFDRNGRRLPALDQGQTRMRIVPIAGSPSTRSQ